MAAAAWQMAAGVETYRFAGFVLDTADRRLRRDGEPVELNARYFDALALLLRERGQLVSKDRFHDEVWRGIPVTDEALTQCIRTLRRALGDDAAAPRFIATVPKHGYRFVAPIEGAAASTPEVHASVWNDRLATVLAAAIGGGLAGMLGGLLYGFAGVSHPLQSGTGAASLLTVMVCVCALVGMIGGAGVGAGLALLAPRHDALPSAIGGAIGGLITGAVANLVGHDVIELLFGISPGAITGAGEGAILGLAVGLGAWWALRAERGLRVGTAGAGLAGAVAGVLVALADGRLMAGSLVELAQRFPASRLRFERIGGLLGEDGFGPLARTLTAAGEGMLFAGGVVGAILWVRRVRRVD